MTYVDGRQKLMVAHRVAWIVSRGPIPDGLFVLHKCDNRACVRLSHLFLGTKSDNNKDMAKKFRCGLSKLTKDQVRLIRRAYKGKRGELQTLAKQYGVTRQCIWYTINKRIGG